MKTKLPAYSCSERRTYDKIMQWVLDQFNQKVNVNYKSSHHRLNIYICNPPFNGKLNANYNQILILRVKYFYCAITNTDICGFCATLQLNIKPNYMAKSLPVELYMPAENTEHKMTKIMQHSWVNN